MRMLDRIHSCLLFVWFKPLLRYNGEDFMVCFHHIVRRRSLQRNSKESSWRTRKHCALAVVMAEPKKFAPPQTPFQGARDGQNLISWRWSLALPTDPVWWRSLHAISSYRGNRPTYKHTHKHIHRQDRLQYTAPLSLARSVKISSNVLHIIHQQHICVNVFLCVGVCMISLISTVCIHIVTIGDQLIDEL